VKQGLHGVYYFAISDHWRPHLRLCLKKIVDTFLFSAAKTKALVWDISRVDLIDDCGRQYPACRVPDIGV
jgi:hypothetical protein